MATKNPKPDPGIPDSSEDRAAEQGRRRASSAWGISTQLSGARGVTADVGSIALDRGLLVGGAAQAAAEPPLRGALADPGLLEMLSDSEVMLRVAAGDDGAFDYLVEKYRRSMISFMYRMTHNQAVAEELAQEVFLRVYRARKQYSPSAKFTTWFFRIATNLALNSVRDNRYRKREVPLDAPAEEDAPPFELPTREMRIDEHMAERDRAEFIRRAVAALPEKQRAAVLLHKYEEMDYGEIAKILDCSESALKSLLFRAYETLRVQLAPLVVQPAAHRAGEGRPS